MNQTEFLRKELQKYSTFDEYDIEVCDKLDNINDARVTMRIAELLQNMHKELSLTENIEHFANKRKSSTHKNIKQRYKARINRVLKGETETPKRSKESIKKRHDTMIERYGALANVEKVKATKLAKYGHMFGNKDQIRQTKIERYGNAMGNVNKLMQTKLEKYGNIYGPNAIERQIATKLSRYGYKGYNMIKVVQTKQDKYGNGMGDVAKLQMTNLQKYGNKNGNVHKIAKTKMSLYGNVFGKVNHKTLSKLNMWWHDLLFEQFGIDFEYEYVLDGYAYDLRYKNLLIEINPQVSHNAVYGFEYLTNHGHNCPLASDYHKNKTLCAINNGYHVINVWDWDMPEYVCMYIEQLLTTYTYDNFEFVDIDTAQHFAICQSINAINIEDTDICLAAMQNDEIKHLLIISNIQNNVYEIIANIGNANAATIHNMLRFLVQSDLNIKTLQVQVYFDKFVPTVYEQFGFIQTSILDTIVWCNVNDKNQLFDIEDDYFNETSIYDKHSQEYAIEMWNKGFIKYNTAGKATYVWHSNQQQ